MTDTLYLRLESTDATATIEGLCMAADGTLRAGGLRGTARELRAAYPGARVTALIPAAEALATSARLPKISAAKLRASVPFALEEQLATELEDQHFALGTPREVAASDGTMSLELPVVVIARARLTSWLELLRAAGAEPAALYLAEECIAPKPGDVVAWVKHEHEVFLRAPSGQGLASSLDDLALSLELLLEGTAPQTVGLQAHAPPGLPPETRTDLIQKIRAGATALARVSGPAGQTDTLGWLVGQLRLAAPIDLLQADFAPRLTRDAATQRWRLAAAMAAVLCALLIADRALALRAATVRERQLAVELWQAAQPSMPGISTPDELLRKLTATSSALQGGERPGAALLQAALADLVVGGLGANSLTSISLESRALRLELLPGVPVEPLAAALRARGWQVDAGAADGGVLVLTAASGAPGSRP